MNPTEKTGNLKEAAAYLVAVALVPVYASMYPVWMQLSGRLDHATLMLLPIVATVSLLGVIILVFRNALTHRRSSRKFVAAGILICCIALLIPDPQLPAKKIHVAEYLLLAGVVRFAMSFRMPPLPLLLFSFLFTALLGVHDEFLQGFLSARTYGLRDMVVNTMGAAGGALIWHGLNLFTPNLREAQGNGRTSGATSFTYLGWLIVSTVFFVWPCMYYTGGKELPFWPAILLAAGGFFYWAYADTFLSSMRHGIGTVSICSFSLILYCLLSNVTKITFF